MKCSSSSVLTLSAIAGLALAGQSVFASTVFSDNFSNGSTVNGSVVTPTSDSTAYQIVSGKSWNPTATVTANDLQFGIGATSGGTVEAQALFSATPITLGAVGNYVDLTLTFTDTSGILTANGFLGMGMYNSYGSAPIAGGLNGTAVSGDTTAVTGGVQNWVGYVGLVGYTGDTSEIMYRLAQSGTGNNNQDLVTTGSGTYSYHNPEGSAVGSSATPSLTVLSAGGIYTDDLKYTLTAGGLQIDNNLYSGSSVSGRPISSLTAVDASPLTTSFDGFGIGYYAKNNASANQFDVSSISVTALAVPEPSALAFAALGLLGAFLPRFRRR